MKILGVILFLLSLAFIFLAGFTANHFYEVHYVEQKAVPDTVIVPETIEKLLYDTVTIRDTVKQIEYIPQTIPADFDSALKELGGE